MSKDDRSAGRWCEVCQQHGNHHTDRHDEFMECSGRGYCALCVYDGRQSS